MDKTSNVKQLRQNTINPSTSSFRLDKCKRYHKIRKLSAVVRATTSSCKESEMGDDLSDRLQHSKRLIGDCNSVGHGSVPRKLRTAMKRRNRESNSFPSPNAKKLDLASSGFTISNSKKSNHKVNGVQPPEKNGVKKSRIKKKEKRSDGSLSKFVGGLVTKDEEEVAETLSALAGMFSNSDRIRKNTLEVSETNSSTWPKTVKNLEPALEDAKVHLNSNGSDSAKRPPNLKGILAGNVVDDTLKEQPGSPIRKDGCTELDSSVPQVNLPTDFLLPSNKPTPDNPFCTPIDTDVPSNLSLDLGIMQQPVQQDTSLPQNKSEFTLGLVNANQSRPEQQYFGKNSKISGREVWSGLNSALLNVEGDCGTDPRHSAQKFSAYQDAVQCDPPQASLKDGSSIEKNYIATKRKLWKRCETHVYISWLIKTLQMTEEEDNLKQDSSKLRLDKGSNLDYFMRSTFKGVKNGLNTVVSTKSDTECASGGDHMKFTEDDLNHRGLQDQKQSSSGSGYNTLQKQGFDILSLSSGGGETGTSSSSGMPWKRQEASSNLQVSYFDSLMQHQELMHASTPQNCYSSMAYPNKLSLPPVTQQTHLQLPPYDGNPPCTSRIALSERHQQQQLYHQQHQQRLWASQLTPQCQPVDASVDTSQIQSWQYGGQDSHVLLSCSNDFLPPALKSGGLPSSKFNIVFQQQQQKVMSLSLSLCPGMVKRPHSNLPLYEDYGGGFDSNDNALPLQLL